MLALAARPHLRALVGAPLTGADVGHIVLQVRALLKGQEPPSVPGPTPSRTTPAEVSTWAQLREAHHGA